jgi:alpha-amylase
MKILIKCHTPDGGPVYIAGNHPSLGDWDPGRAMAMQLQNGSAGGGTSWSAVLDLEPGRTVEYKFVKRSDAGGVQWENGWNRTYTAVPGISSISDEFRT